MWQIGQTIDNRYKVLQILGGPNKSGMGVVYVCDEQSFRTPVAIKTPQDNFFIDRHSKERFLWEAEVWIRLGKHHNVVYAQYLTNLEDRPCIIMDYIVGDENYGTNLSGWIYRGGLKKEGQPLIPKILDISIQVCRGMTHAENKFREISRPFVHRDIKPQNILITRDSVVKVTDFGLVKAFAALQQDIPAEFLEDGFHKYLSFSKNGQICGTPAYMSPEQFRGQSDIDVRSDIYSFGCVLYEMLMGKPVFESRSVEEYRHHHLHSIPRSTNSNSALDAIVQQCLEKLPEHRYTSFAELEETLTVVYRNITGKVPNVISDDKLSVLDMVHKGVSLANLGMSNEAIDCFQEAIKINPFFAPAYYNLAVEHDKLGKNDTAIDELRKAIGLEPSYSLAHAKLGLIYGNAGEFDLAIEECQAALRFDPNMNKAYIALGYVYLQQGKYDLAALEIKKSLKLNPMDAATHDQLGDVYLHLNQLDMSLMEFKEAIKINPDQPQAHNGLGTAYQRLGRLNEALAEFQKAVKMEPWVPHGHVNLGTIYAQLGKRDMVLAEYKEAIKLDPDLVIAHVALARAYLETLDFNLSIQEFKEVLRINPSDSWAHTGLGVIYTAMGTFNLAIAKYREALKIDPMNAQARNSLSDVIAKLGKHETQADRNPEILPVNIETLRHFDLANSYRKRGNNLAATVEYKEVLKIAPNHVESHNYLGVILAVSKKHEMAIAEYQEAIMINSGYAPAHYNMAIALKELGKLNEAVTEYKNALRIDPSLIEATYNMAVVFQQIGQLQDALLCFRDFIRTATIKYASHIGQAEKNIRQIEQLLK